MKYVALNVVIPDSWGRIDKEKAASRIYVAVENVVTVRPFPFDNNYTILNYGPGFYDVVVGDTDRILKLFHDAREV